MISKHILPALAVIGSAAAQSSTCTVSATTATINSQADATSYANCDTIKGSLLIGTTAGDIDLSGPSIISGSLTVQNNGAMLSLSSSTLTEVGSALTLNNITRITTVSFPELQSCGSISIQSLPNLGDIVLTKGISKASSVVISDTFLDTLDGIDITTATDMDINNNRRLSTWDSKLENLSDLLNIQANGQNLTITFDSLVWIANMTIANVTSFSVPALETVNGSARFDSNYFTSFAAPNLTSTKSGDISFVSNSALTNISFPSLTSLGGALQIANNTDMAKVNGFALLATVGGAIKLRGNFTDVEFPALSDVKGAFDVVSTGDISSSCDTFSKLKATSSGGNGVIQGTYNCQSNNANANSDTGTGTSSGSGSDSGSSTGNSTAAGVVVNYALLGLAGVAGFAQLF